MINRQNTTVFFRNDDVNHLEPGLREMTELLVGTGVPVSHAVEPANLAEDTRDWLLAGQGKGVEIIQHGFSHARHDVGEFGGNRRAEDQRQDLIAGKRIMSEAFGTAFFPAMSFPFGAYNEYSPRILDELGYAVISSHMRCQFKRQVFYRLGRTLRRGRWLGRHVSHHLGRYPGTRLLEISVSISPIKRYLHAKGPCACEYFTTEELMQSFSQCRQRSPVVGVVLHHRFHADATGLGRLEDFLVKVRSEPGVSFADLSTLHRQFSSPRGARK